MRTIIHYLISLATAFFLFYFSSNAQPIGTAVIHDKLRSTDSTIVNQRMRLNGVASTCDSVKPTCPGYFGSTGVYYKNYCYTNESSNTECIEVMLEKEIYMII